MATEKEPAKIGSTPGRIRTEPRCLPSLDPSNGYVVASVAGTAVVGESPVARIVVDGIEVAVVEDTSDAVGGATASAFVAVS